MTGRTSAWFNRPSWNFASPRVLEVAEDEPHLTRLARRQRQRDLMRADTAPTRARPNPVACPVSTTSGPVPAPIRTEERVARRVEPDRILRAREVREVIAPLAVLGEVEDHVAVDLDLARVQVALEVGLVVPRVPQAELDRGEQRQRRGRVAPIRHSDAPRPRASRRAARSRASRRRSRPGPTR